MTRCNGDSAIDVCQGLPLHDEALIYSVRLAQNTICHVMTVVNVISLAQHVVCLCCLRVVCALLVDIGLDIAQEIGAVASLLQDCSKTDKIAPV